VDPIKIKSFNHPVIKKQTITTTKENIKRKHSDFLVQKCVAFHHSERHFQFLLRERNSQFSTITNSGMFSSKLRYTEPS